VIPLRWTVRKLNNSIRPSVSGYYWRPSKYQGQRACRVRRAAHRNPDASHASYCKTGSSACSIIVVHPSKLAVTLVHRHRPISAASIAYDSDYLVLDIFCRAYINPRPLSPPSLQAQGFSNAYFFPGTFMRCRSSSTAAIFASILPAQTPSDHP
jgi:hypothetical protein